MLCPKCSAQMQEGATVCPVCGQTVEDSVVIEVVDQRKPNLFKRPLAFFRSLRFKTKAILAIVTSTVLVLIGVWLLLPHHSVSRVVVYQNANNRLYYTDNTNYGKSELLSEAAFGDNKNDVVFDEDKQAAFYPYHAVESGEGYILRYGDQEQQIAVDVTEYQTVLSDTGLYYRTTSNMLYYSNLKQSEQVASAVTEFHVGVDSGDVVWQSEDHKIYHKAFGGEVQLMAEQANILFVADDASSVVYAGDQGALYSHKLGADPILIGVGVSDARIFSADSMYYLIRSNITSEDIGSAELYTLYYYNGAQSVTVSDDCKVIDSGLKQELMFTRTGSTKAQYQLNLICREVSIPIALPYSEVLDAVVDETGEHFYYIVGTPEANTLYYAAIDVQNRMLTDPVEIDQNVSVVNRVNYAFDTVQGKQCYYFKNTTDNGFGDLYINGKKVAENVNTSTTIYSYAKGTHYVFCSDIYEDSGIGSLVSVEGDTIKVLGENVVQFEILDGTDVAFICNADYESKVGRLCVYKAGSVYTVDGSVSAICYATKAQPIPSKG